MQVVPASQVPLPAHPVPPHCAYFGNVPPVPGDEVGVPEDGCVVTGVSPPEADNLLLTNDNACWPYLEPYCWCELASLPLQQYGSVESQ